MSITKFQGDKYGVIFLFLEMFTWSHFRFLLVNLICYVYFCPEIFIVKLFEGSMKHTFHHKLSN